MADELNILQGSFKNIAIAIDSASIQGGRKVAVKQFPNRDTQSVEDLGLMPRKYTLELVVSELAQTDYFSYRNSLIAALESKGPGELIHPLYGRIDSVVAVSYSINETFTAFGYATITANFEINNSTGIPETTGNIKTQIQFANDAVVSAVNADIKDNFLVSNKFVGNFGSAVDKVNAIIDQAKESTAFIGEASDRINEFSAEIGELSANVNSLVSDPLALADSITGLFESVNGLYASSKATFDTFTGFFGFGSDDIETKLDTAGRIERSANSKLLNNSVAASTLGYAYLAMVEIDFESTEEIETLTAQLDAQYDLVTQSDIPDSDIASGLPQDVKDAITDMRVKVLATIDQERVNTSQVITVYTNPTTARVLAFNYYGDDTQGENIINLNDLSDVSFVDGDIKVLTQ